nr:DEAD/DEAH box helicase family protein [uncultured Sphaerochaeta sp.]
MARSKQKGLKQLGFKNKLILNQWMISLFGIDPLATQQDHSVRPFHKLADPIRDTRLEGLDADNLHFFYHHLAGSPLFSYAGEDARGIMISPDLLLTYEQNIVRYTLTINEKRQRPIIWKYYQWLTLLFVEIYLDRFFSNKEKLRDDLNEYVDKFNNHWKAYADMPYYSDDDLNKICLQNATGSGKTLLMHINLLQYQHYAKLHGKSNDLSRVILLTPNERLSDQHINEFHESGFGFVSRLQPQNPSSLGSVDVIEITKLGDREGPNTIATRSLGDQNLLLVDEGHRGMSGKDEGVWFTRRSGLCEKGFTFEYSATFEQAVLASGNIAFENSYAKAVLFDYSYRWFYEDGFGKDYQILNLPASFEETRTTYMTACLLKYYQQLRIYQDMRKEFEVFYLEKPLWVFVGSTVSSGKLSKEEKIVATDVALIIQYLADFLGNDQASIRRIRDIISGRGQDTGLLDSDGNDIFAGAFGYLAKLLNSGVTIYEMYKDIKSRLFNSPGGGHLILNRIKGESGEIALRVGTGEEAFGLINVGDAKGLTDHIELLASQKDFRISIEDSDFSEAMFSSVKDSSSHVNLLIGSKKFIEGWDCWRVSTLGLMHVGRSEGSQIIQLFGRGVRLKGYNWSLKRSVHSRAPVHPRNIEELETLNVFGIEADFMEKFRDFLKDEGLPGNERRRIITIPLNVTYDFGKKLKILRPKRKSKNGIEYDFKKDAPVPSVGDIPEYLIQRPVESDWYPRIQSMRSQGVTLASAKDQVILRKQHLALLDYDSLYFEIEQFKRERSWHNLNVSKQGIRSLLEDSSWYKLYFPEARLIPSSFDGVLLLQQVVAELVKRYCDHYYNYRKREYFEPRLELRELKPEDDNIPKDENYQLITDGDEEQLIHAIEKIKADLAKGRDDLLHVGDLYATNFGQHLFQPLFHVRKGGKINIVPFTLTESEFQFVRDLKEWCTHNAEGLQAQGVELFLLRNMSRGKGVGFFEAGNFHPDFILWMLVGYKQYVTFIEPHGLVHEGPASEKIQFYSRIKDVEKRLNELYNPNQSTLTDGFEVNDTIGTNVTTILNSFILSWTKYPQLQWQKTREELEDKHVLFMTDDRDGYIGKMFERLGIG